MSEGKACEICGSHYDDEGRCLCRDGQEPEGRHQHALRVRVAILREQLVGQHPGAGTAIQGLESTYRTLRECLRHLREWEEEAPGGAERRLLEDWQETVAGLRERWQDRADRQQALRGEVVKREALEITSQPGDGTRYHYLMILPQNGQAPYRFLAAEGSRIKYPTAISRPRGPQHVLETIDKIARSEGCNPYTVRECLRAMAAHQGWLFRCPMPLPLPAEQEEVTR